MARERNLKNLKTEKEGISILRKHLESFHVPSNEERKYIYKTLNIDFKKYSRSIDGIFLNVDAIKNIKSEEDVTLVEIKTTKAKNITKLPYGAFFGITENEETLFKAMNNFKLCIVHSVTEDFVLLNYSEYISLIQNKRVQYQVNFKTKNG